MPELTPAAALQNLADLFGDPMFAESVGGHLNCDEADIIAAALRLVDPEAAQTFLTGHGFGDDDVDDDLAHKALAAAELEG